MKFKREDIINYSIISFGLFPIIPNKLKGLLLIFVFLTSLNYYLKDKNKENYFKPFLINTALLFVYVLSMFYTSDISYAFRKLGPGISIIFFPLIFFIFLGSFKVKREIINKALNLFSISTLAFLFIYFIYLFFVDRPINPYFDFPTTIFFRNTIDKLPIIGRHPIYISLFLGISIINTARLLIYYFKSKKNVSILLVIAQIIFISVLFLISSKGTILSLIVISIFIYYLSSKNKIKTILFGLLTSFLLIISISFIPQVNKRFKELFVLKTYSVENIHDRNSSQIRVAIWKTSFDKIKQSPIIGYGIGDVQIILNNSYKNISPILLKRQYNSHNQYLGIWLSTGIIGLILFLYFLLFNYKLSLEYKDYLFLSILLFFSLNFLTENIIERQTGAMLFFFLINLFSASNYKKIKE